MVRLKRCDICGTFNFKENSYCTHCGNKLIIDHICPFCGESNLNHATYCINCQKQINPIGDNTMLPFSAEKKIFTEKVWREIDKYIDIGE